MRGAVLRAQRELMGISGSDVARYLGRVPSAISHLEQRESVGAQLAERYIEALTAIAAERLRDQEALELGRLMLAGAAGQ